MQQQEPAMTTVINNALNEGNYDTAWEEYSKGLIAYPTNPTLWYNRSVIDYLKGFPELAIMDATRSLKLLEDEVNKSNNEFELLTIKNFIIKCLDLIGKSMGDVGSYEKGTEMYEKAIRTFDETIENYKEKIMMDEDFNTGSPINAKLTKLENEINLEYFQEQKKIYQKELDYKVELMKTKYPTLNESFIKTFMVNVSFKFNGSYPWDKPISNNNELQYHNYIADELRNDDHITLSSINYERDIEISENRKYQQLAIVAKKNIPKGEIIFQEIAFVSVHESSSLKCDYCHVPLNHSSKITCENSSCSDIFCTKSCNTLALQLNHSLLCGNILYYSFKNKLYNLLQIGVINNIVYFEILLMLKLFSIAKTRDVCPLDIQEIKYLSRFNRQISSSNVNINNKINQKKIEFPERIFELYQDILEILQISIHDLQYDFWIFLTTWSIIKSNLIQLNPTFQNEVVGIFTVSGLLNHSCTNANVKVKNFGLGLSETKLGYGIILETTKDIMKDQELFLSYCDVSKIPKDRKKSYLLRYFGFECRCSDCQQY
nr:8704_t:CDS:1 [Entrophospora candida]